MRYRHEQLESRLAMAATIWDTNPGPYSSDVTVIRQVDDWLYLDATIGDQRRLIKTDGQDVVDIGPGLELEGSFIRDDDLIGVTPQGVVQFDFETDTLTVLSTEPGAKVLGDDTVYWYTRVREDISQTPEDELYHITVDYHDLDGRTFSWDETVRAFDSAFGFNTLNVLGDTIVASGQPRASFDVEIFLIRNGEILPTPATDSSPNYHVELGEQLYFLRGNGEYVTESGDIAFYATNNRIYPFPGGAWLINGSVISRLDGGQVQTIGDVAQAEWNPSLTGFVQFWDSDRLIFNGETDLWGSEPYAATSAGIEFLGNFGFGPQSSLFHHVRNLGEYDLLMTGTQSTRGWQLLDSNNHIVTIAPPGELVMLTDEAFVVKTYTEETGNELTRYDLVSGDANFDGIFDSADLVHLFQLGEYEDSLVGNSSRATGDFDGNGEFDSSDIVLAFQAGQYIG